MLTLMWQHGSEPAPESGLKSPSLRTDYRVEILDASGVVVHRSALQGSSATSYVVPLGVLSSGVEYRWRPVAIGNPLTGVCDTNGATCSFVADACVNTELLVSDLPDGSVGEVYSEELTVSGGTGPYTFAVSSDGELPGGLTLNVTTGVVSGTPTTAETQNFVITVTDALGCTGSRSYTVIINS